MFRVGRAATDAGTGGPLCRSVRGASRGGDLPIKRLTLIVAMLGACAGPQAPTPRSQVSQLCVVRHAQAYKNLASPPADLTPEQLDSLTPAGQAQGRALQASLPPDVAEVRSSPAQRTRQTAELLAGPIPVQVEPRLRPLDGAISWDTRMAAWSRGEDPRPADGESLADGAARAASLIAELRAQLPPGGHAVWVTHGDIAAVLLGELRGTPLLDRPRRDAIETGAMVCLPLAVC